MPVRLPSLDLRRGGLLAVALTLAFGAVAPRAMGQADAARVDPAGVADQVRRRGDYADRLPVAASEDIGSGTRIFGGGASGGGGSGAGDRALGGGDDPEEARSPERSRAERRGASRDRAPAALPMAGGGSILLWLGIALLVGVLVFVLASVRPKGGALAEAPSKRGDAEAPVAPPA